MVKCHGHQKALLHNLESTTFDQSTCMLCIWSLQYEYEFHCVNKYLAVIWHCLLYRLFGIDCDTLPNLIFLLTVGLRRKKPSLMKIDCFKSLWPSDAIWRHTTVTALVQIMVRCLTASSRYLNLRWLIISEGLGHTGNGNFTGNLEPSGNLYPRHKFQNN